MHLNCEASLTQSGFTGYFSKFLLFFISACLLTPVSQAFGSELSTVLKVNAFWNAALKESSDTLIWNKKDYWATPQESLKKGYGDCEDFAFGKYFDLLAHGVSPSKLRLLYGKTGFFGTNGHIVLAYYDTQGQDPLILDNLTSSIKRLSDRSDFTMVYGFDKKALYINGQERSLKHLRPWKDLQKRVASAGTLIALSR